MPDFVETFVDANALVSLESILCTEELTRRPLRAPDYESENRALVTLAQALADSPSTILQKMSEIMLTAFRADSAGFSLLGKEGGETRFHWPAIAGLWKPHIGGGTPRDFGPCGDVLDRNAPLLFKHFERRYPYFLPVMPLAHECLLVPFYIGGEAVGTIWVISHSEDRKFDAEDKRQLVNLGAFASSAYRAQEKTVALVADSRRKDEFLATLAHELRNPLAPMRNALQVMQMACNDVAAMGMAREIMERQVKQMVRLVDDLLDVSRISRGRLDLRLQQVELAAVIRAAVEMSRPIIEAAGHQLTVTLPSQPVYVDADSGRLAQVIANLLNNAAKYSDKGGQVWLSVERQGSDAVVGVRDAGMGIAAEMLPRVFDLFMQVDHSLERSQGGLGIGLTLVKRLVELHGGSVEARSKGAGKGSEFLVRLPVILVPTWPRPAAGEGEATASPAPVKLRILVADDNEDAAHSLGMMLRLMGHETHIVHNGLAAVEAAETYQPVVVMLDIGMPKLNGYEAARRIRRLPDGEGRVLVALTGWGQEEDKRRAQEAGFDHHMVKPVNPADLQTVLAEVGRSFARV